MKAIVLPLAVLVSWTGTVGAVSVAPPTDLDKYNVVWTSPSRDASGAMPLGNGEVGMNLWVEPNGDVVFYISRTDAWSEACRLLKLGRVRVSLDPPLVAPRTPFRQELDLKSGSVHISAGDAASACALDIVVDPDHPTIHFGGHSGLARKVRICLETWRTQRQRLTGRGGDAELTSSWTMHDAPDSVEVWESPDLILDDANGITWCHRNEDSVVPFTLRHQGLEALADKVMDPLLHRTFGGVITPFPAHRFAKLTPTILYCAEPITDFRFSITTHCAQSATPEQWREDLKKVAYLPLDAPPDAPRTRAARWWADFWSRSWVFISGDPSTPFGVPVNDHPITFGQDSSGGNRFAGEVMRAGIYQKVYADNHIANFARGAPTMPPPLSRERFVSFTSVSKPGDTAPDSAGARFPEGLTLEAWIKPDPQLQSGRILDKITPGAQDGFLFDVQPGASLRFIVGAGTLTATSVLKLGAWNHVAATCDAATGRMRLFVAGRQVASAGYEDPPAPSLITRGYALQRYIQACGGHGNYPIKFNGSIFTVDARYTTGVVTSPDFRRWGDCYWWQNTRLPYHPMLAAGDFEMMDPLFRLFENARPLSEARAKLYYSADGVYFPETMTIFGAYSNGDYGWDRTGHQPSEVLCPWWQWAWNQGTELACLMLDRYEYTRDDIFARQRLVPMSSSVLRYFDSRFKRDAAGKLVISPTQSIETYWKDVTNDMPCVAGLQDLTTRLLALPTGIGSPEDRALWQRVHDALPPIPTREEGGVRMLAPAEKYDPQRNNCEAPELYSVFPHRLYGLQRPGIELAIEAYKRRHDKATQGWTQDGQFAALLGLTDEAKANILAKARNSHQNHRFPAMWGPNFDWLPDQDHGANLMHVVQCMLLQPVGEKLLVLPAWPKEWNVSFKLHAPRNTTVECEYKDGKVVRLEVTPESRRGDVQVMLGGQ